MPTKATFRLRDAEFTRTLRVYRQLSSRDPATITNTKGFFIARRATVETEKTPREAILAFAKSEGGRIVGMLINKQRAAEGLHGLHGPQMEAAVATLVGQRMRSRAFLASGWVPAIKRLAPLAQKRGVPQQDRVARQVGREKGFATPARIGGWIAKTVIGNTAQAKWDKGGAEARGLKGLEVAWAFELQSMKEYIEMKMKETAKEAGIRTR